MRKHFSWEGYYGRRVLSFVFFATSEVFFFSIFRGVYSLTRTVTSPVEQAGMSWKLGKACYAIASKRQWFSHVFSVGVLV